MVCPKCESDMEKVTFGPVEVDRCTNCDGIWFDRLERETLIEIEGAESIDVGDPDVGRNFDAVASVDCPVCHVQMTRMVDTVQSQVRFETCPSCDGAFFDAGEFSDYSQQALLGHVKHLLPSNQD